MAIALTPFEALCGFRPVPEIKKFVEGGSICLRSPTQIISKNSKLVPIFLKHNDNKIKN